MPCSSFNDLLLTVHIVTPPSNPEDATKQALLAVVQVWLDRLSAMSIVVSTSDLVTFVP